MICVLIYFPAVSVLTTDAFHTFCRIYGKKLKKTSLLYPVKQKDYQADAAIAQHWKKFEEALQCAFAFTVFGYGAPKTDIEAVHLMKSAWGDASKRQLEQTEIIDVKNEDDLLDAWEPFINSHHYEVRDSFYDSYIAQFPRWSCEAIWNQFMECEFFAPHAFPRNASFPDLYDWLKPRTDAERKSDGHRGKTTNGRNDSSC